MYPWVDSGSMKVFVWKLAIWNPIMNTRHTSDSVVGSGLGNHWLTPLVS